ncbi:MAG: glycosyltransferase [Methylotenera sp.]|nr:glycosyltransferase [Methylotenera sp.]MSP99629.1 glycosyltransferase [Methylotenera sp.]
MKVVQVLPALDGGGVEKGILEIAQALVQAGHESVVISAGGRMVEKLIAQGSQHVNWDLGKKSLLTFRHVFAIRCWLKQARPDILHLRSRMPAWLMYLAWRSLPAADRPHLVTTVHGLYSVSKYSEIMCKGERVIAVSETVREYIKNNYPNTNPLHIKLIYRGVDPVEFPYGYQPPMAWVQQWQQDFPQLEGKKILTLPGRLTRLKGHHDFIDLILKLKQSDHSTHGLIVGGEDPKRRQYVAELRHRIHLEGLDDVITFTGNRPDIREIYAISDVVLSLSTKPESFGRTVLEALSMGVPVVGYDHGGVGEILSVLYPQGKVRLQSVASLLSAVLPILASHTTETITQVTHSMTLSAMCKQTIDLYEETYARAL